MSVPYTFTPNTTISSDAVNANFSYLDTKNTFTSVNVTASSTSSALVSLTATSGTFPFLSFTDANNVAAVAGGGTTLLGALYLRVGGTSAAFTKVTVTSAGNFGVNTTSPTGKMDINSDTLRLRTAKTPTSASDTGNIGDICWDSSYMYVCVATNTWKRAALATW